MDKQKPSDRINEIVKEKEIGLGGAFRIELVLGALLQYLDEQQEQESIK